MSTCYTYNTFDVIQKKYHECITDSQKLCSENHAVLQVAHTVGTDCPSCEH